MVPVRSCKGVSEFPVTSPVGVRAGVTNRERAPTAEVGAPCTFVGSAGTGEDQHGGHVDELERGNPGDDVAHQRGQAFGVVDHPGTPLPTTEPCAHAATGE